MGPVTRLWTITDCMSCLRALALRPVCRLQQAGVFFSHCCMFLYKRFGVLLLLASLLSANAGEVATMLQQGELANTAAGNEQGGERQLMKLASSGSAAANLTTANDRVDTSKVAPGKIASRVAADRKHRSVNVIGARRSEAAANIVQREDHQFYVVRPALLHSDQQKNGLSNNRSQAVDAGARIRDAVSAGNLLVDQSLLRKSATPSKDGRR